MNFEPSETDRLLQLAAAAKGAGRESDARQLLEDALRVEPSNPLALTWLAEALLLRRDHAKALELLHQALMIEPYFAPAWHQRAQAYWIAGRQAESLDAARRAVNIQPPNPKFRMQLAQFAAWTGHGAEARDALAPLLANRHHDKDSASLATGMLGELAIAEGRFEEAEGLLVEALTALPQLHATRMMRGMNQLRRGFFSEGWLNYAARESVAFLYPDGAPDWPGEVWRGQPLAGKTILVTDDQGRGDTIQFFRYMAMLRDLGAAHITWLTFEGLVSLLARSAPDATILGVLPHGSSFDFNCSSSSLPRWFGTTLDNIPGQKPYLVAPHRRIRTSSRRPLNVGLVWSGDPKHARDHLRSIPAAEFLRLADDPALSIYSLQFEVRTTDLPALHARPHIDRLVEQGGDFAGTAALIAKLDMVISVDTAVAHLAAAMGKPVWLIVHVAPDWRWMVDRSDSPWYPTMRLFRVRPGEWDPGNGGWKPVLERVAVALRQFSAAR